MASDTGSDPMDEYLKLLEFNLVHGTPKQKAIAVELLLRLLEDRK